MFKRSNIARRAAVALLALSAAPVAWAVPVATVGDVDVWNVGSGQSNGDFQVMTDVDFAGGRLQLGIRATERKVGNTTPSGDIYRYDTGHSAGGGVSDTMRARWNFDLHVSYDGMISDLDSLTLAIGSSNPVNVPTAPVVDLLDVLVRGNIDCHTRAPACASGTPPVGTTSSGPHTGNPANFYQASQNPVFGWFTPVFDFDVAGVYSFELAAARDNSTLSTSMRVAVPEPASLTLTLLGLAALRRRR